MIDLPFDFISRTKRLLGKDWDMFQNALNSKSPVSIRLNEPKAKVVNISSFSPVLWNKQGFYLDKRPQFTFDPLFHTGCYYVQEASSMFVGHALNQYIEGDVKVLDLCAAPGGKSSLIASMISDQSLLVSNEVIRSRANILSENMAKWGRPNVVVANNDPVQIGKLHNFFDVILVDAPCSGEGMFRKDEGAIAEWSVENVKLCKERQQRILADIWPALKTGGLLLYSTCTYNLEENENNVEWIRDELGAEPLPVNIKEGWGISPSFVDDVPAYRFFPYKTEGEGFFFALLRKTDDIGSLSNDQSKKQKIRSNKSREILGVEYKNYLLNSGDFIFYSQKDKWYAFLSPLYDNLLLLETFLNIISGGICLGTFKGKDFIPDQSLALSIYLDKEKFHICEVDWKTSIHYLRKEPLVLPAQPKGLILLTYKKMPLGFVKNIGNRANNIYPQEWRIRSSNIPDEPVNIGLF